MRARDEIVAQMDAVQAADPALVGLADVNSNTSNVSFMKLLKNFFAQMWQLVENQNDLFQAQVNNQIAENRAGSLQWLVSQVKAFQFGDAIAVINGRVAYDVVDVAKRIVAHSAATEDVNTGRVLIKAIKTAGIPLTNSELAALKDYVSKVKFAGVQVDVSSLDADEIKLLATVKIDPKVLAADGSLLTNAASFPVWDAIVNYCQNMPFNSVINNTLLTDAIQAVPGVQDFTITGSFTRRPSVPSWSAYARETEVIAGHLTVQNESIISYVN